jgi:hypothetical protein
MSFILNILFFPLDLLYLTIDTLRISMDRLVYSSVRSGKDQPCIHCKNRDCGYRPRRIPRGLRKYRNRGIGYWLQPCIIRKESIQGGPRRVCNQDGGFVIYSKWIHVLTVLCLIMWFGFIRLGIHLIY